MENFRRLKQVSITLEIGTSTIVEYLKAKGYYLENKPTTKITQAQYELIVKELAALRQVDLHLNKQPQLTIPKAKDTDISKTKSSDVSKTENSILLKKFPEIRKVSNSVNEISKLERPKQKSLSGLTILEPHSIKSNIDLKQRELNQRTVWEKYIQAQEKILDHQALPIAVKPEFEINDSGKLKLEVDQDIFKKAFASDIREVFKLKEGEFSYEQGYILQSVEVTKSISAERLISMRNEAKKFYIEFNENPVIEGEITTKDNPFSIIEAVTGESRINKRFRNESVIYLTRNQREKLEQYSNYFSFETQVGAVFPVKPTLSYYISKYYKNSDIRVSANSDKVVVKNGELHPAIISKFQNEIDLKLSSYKLKFHIVADHDITTNTRINEKHKLFFSKNEGAMNSKVTLPAPYNNKFSFHFNFLNDNIEKIDLSFEYNRLLRTLKRFYGAYEITSEYFTFYSFDRTLVDSCIEGFTWDDEQFWNDLYATIHGDEFQVSQNSNTVSFDFETVEQLNHKLRKLKAVKHINVVDYEEGHKFKYKIRVKNDLPELSKKLNQVIPSLTTKIVANGTKLHFRFFYKSGGRQIALAILNNTFESVVSSLKYSLYIDNLFKEKYICEENFELKEEEENDKLSKLKGREFYIGDKKNKLYIGTLRKVNYPKLELLVENTDLAEFASRLDQNRIKAIIPDLKGDKDKIVRLRETMVKLHSSEKLPNDNVKQFLFDSSKAEAIQEIDFLLNKNSAAWLEFEKHIYSKNLNESQKEAVLKAIKGKELVLIQGPPGTGKSTAIAEIIWQHVRVNQNERLLLTSETNLAVDNAIDRLRNPNHNLVKPIRFGSDDKLESEGLFYSLAEMGRWTAETKDGNNALSHWLSNITARIDSTTIAAAPLERWKQYLSKPSKDTRSLFMSTYVKYANVIGATGSSIGFKNSEGNWTSFYRSYLQVVAGDNYVEKAKKSPFKISFDTVIMDEASKATPPELALPLIYAKKSIIVGDHRQLPPLLDGEEIKDKLTSIGESKLARTLSRNEFNISQFERLFTNIDSSIKATFNTQYRMHPAINDVIKQFYVQDGGLNCGLPHSESDHSSFSSPASRYHGLANDSFLDPHIHTIWVDVNEPEMLEGTSRINYGEVEAVKRVLDYINNSHGFEEFRSWLRPQPLEEQQVGLISFYGKQIKLLKQLTEDYQDKLPIRVSTVDRFQGMERNIIIVSMVRSNTIATSKDQRPNLDIYPQYGYPIQDSLGFAESPNRLNVALSRARRLLVIVGNSQHFCKKEIYRNVYNSIKTSPNGRIIDYKQLTKYISE